MVSMRCVETRQPEQVAATARRVSGARSLPNSDCLYNEALIVFQTSLRLSDPPRNTEPPPLIQHVHDRSSFPYSRFAPCSWFRCRCWRCYQEQLDREAGCIEGTCRWSVDSLFFTLLISPPLQRLPTYGARLGELSHRISLIMRSPKLIKHLQLLCLHSWQ